MCYAVWGGSILPLVSWSRVAYFVVFLTVPWMCWSSYIVFCPEYRRLSCTRSWKLFEVRQIPEYIGGSGGSMWRIWSCSNHLVWEPARRFLRSFHLLTLNFFTCCWSASSLLHPFHSAILSRMIFQGLYLTFLTDSALHYWAPNVSFHSVSSQSRKVAYLFCYHWLCCQVALVKHARTYLHRFSKVVPRSSVNYQLSSRPLNQMLQLNNHSFPWFPLYTVLSHGS
jgi:hypothetical protein